MEGLPINRLYNVLAQPKARNKKGSRMKCEKLSIRRALARFMRGELEKEEIERFLREREINPSAFWNLLSQSRGLSIHRVRDRLTLVRGLRVLAMGLLIS